jgi:hypothetical protein
MTETAEAIKIQRGLKGIYFERSPCTFIDGKAGELRFAAIPFMTSPSIRRSRRLPGFSSMANCRPNHNSQASMPSSRLRVICPHP